MSEALQKYSGPGRVVATLSNSSVTKRLYGRSVRENSSIRQARQEREAPVDPGTLHHEAVLPDEEWHAVRHAIVAYVVRKGHSRDVAEDVAQDSLAKLLHYTDKGRPASIYALALKIAANSLVDRVRGETRFGPPVDETFVCGAPLPDRVAEDRQQLERLTAALANIPPLRRAVLVKRRLENQSHASIAAELGLSIAAVEKHVVRGLCDLRRVMKDCVGHDKVMP